MSAFFFFFKLNGAKTEILITGTKAALCKVNGLCLTIDGSDIFPADTVHNLGITFDSSLNFISHISSVTKTAFFHLHNTAHLHSSLTFCAAETLVHSLITPLSDYCNSLFIIFHSMDKLQYV